MSALGVGWFGILFFWAFYSGTMPLFLREFTDSKFTISLVLTLAGISGCIVPPVVGFLSDRTRSRYGCRRPYIFFGMLGVFVCFIALPHVQAFAAVIFVSALSYFCMDTAQTPYMALLPDITPAHQRSTASGVMSFFGNVGLMACFFLSSRLWEEYRVELFYLVSLITAGCTLAAIALLKEPAAPVVQLSARANPFRHLRGLAKERNAMKFFLAQFFWWLGFWVVQSFLTLFMVESLNVPEGKALLAPFTATVLQTCFVLPFGLLGDRFSRKRILFCMILFWAAVQSLIGFSHTYTQAIVLVSLTGIPLAAVGSVAYAFMLDLIPAGRTAEFVGLGVISMAAPQIFGPMTAGALIDSSGYPLIFPTAAACMLIASLLTLSIHTNGTHEPAPAALAPPEAAYKRAS